MENKAFFNEINKVSADAKVTPSDAVWQRLEQRLNEQAVLIEPPVKSLNYFSVRRLAFAASIIILIGAYTVLNNLGTETGATQIIQLEDLHTLEINPKYNIPAAGESSTIPSVRLVRSIQGTYKGIEEGSANQRLVPKTVETKEKEYGLG